MGHFCLVKPLYPCIGLFFQKVDPPRYEPTSLWFLGIHHFPSLEKEKSSLVLH